ncbi:MAG: hypothetical protein HBSAPP02_07560 [Phycisphaerae bacterium]|nr:MAG: hypothetical protein HRU71_00215 [Planctomycetia bacterium]GJQ25724.1 MAG: hypothetical protein HBSAPP02_07560 [Phycisphaerae bacterium]
MIVLDSIQPVIRHAKHVFVDDAAIARWVQQTPRERLLAHPGGLHEHFPGDADQIANLVLLISAMNFCFWSDNPIRIQWRGQTYERFNAMLVSILLSAKSDPRWFDAAYWAEVTPQELKFLLAGSGELLLMEERLRIVRETAAVLLDRFDGQFSNAVESVNHRAWPLAVLLMTNFDSFRDVAGYRGSPVFFMKRAQICAMDLAQAWAARGGPMLTGLEELTAFADYRVPQILRHLGILRVSESLAAQIDAGLELAAGSGEEVELRAASIEAVDRMSRQSGKMGRPIAPWVIDCQLWERSHGADVTVPHHRTRTIYY